MLNPFQVKRTCKQGTPRFLVTLTGLFAAALMTPIQALTLGDAIEQALRNDPTYLAAQANAQANRARSSQAFGRLLPQLTASANSNDNRRNYSVLNSQIKNTQEHYNSHGSQVNLTQPLLHAEKYLALNQADMLVSQAEYQLAAAEKDLLVRLVQVWLDIRQTADSVSASDSKLQASRQELDLAQHASARGVMSMTELSVSMAHYEQARSEQVAAQTEQLLKLAELEQIIGQNVLKDGVPANVLLSERFSSLDPNRRSVEQWSAEAENGSPAILAARRALDAANEEVSKQRAGHLPTLDLVASYNNAVQGSGLTGGQAGFRNIVNSVGVQLNVPLFSGGEQNAKVGEALAMRDKASHELEATRRSVHLKIKQAWLTWKASFARQQFGEQAVESAINALKSAHAQNNHGLKADLDVLQAQQQWQEARRDMNKARNDAILNYFKLYAETGQLVGDDLLAMESQDRAIAFEAAHRNSASHLHVNKK
jgi:outer membrane protein